MQVGMVVLRGTSKWLYVVLSWVSVAKFSFQLWRSLDSTCFPWAHGHVARLQHAECKVLLFLFFVCT